MDELTIPDVDILLVSDLAGTCYTKIPSPLLRIRSSPVMDMESHDSKRSDCYRAYVTTVSMLMRVQTPIAVKAKSFYSGSIEFYPATGFMSKKKDVVV